MFHPGETISHKFTIPFVAEEIKKVIVTYKQDDQIILTKTITSNFIPVTPTKTYFIVAMNQEESLAFKERKHFKIQLNVLGLEGSRATSCEIDSETGVQHYKEVMTDV